MKEEYPEPAAGPWIAVDNQTELSKVSEEELLLIVDDEGGRWLGYRLYMGRSAKYFARINMPVKP